MRTFKEIRTHYGFTEKDEQMLVSVKALMTENADRVMDALHTWLIQTPDTARFFTEEARKRHVFGSHRQWFIDLFSGRYDHAYYERLIRIGQSHVKSKVDAHYMNRAINIVRNVCIDILIGRCTDINAESYKSQLIS
ncbi:MAG: protoglobin domain-containing protein, partial [Nitrospirae bacterium]|nr:protoglobin domain-containing protein [Nitrospirota bacterium]